MRGKGEESREKNVITRFMLLLLDKINERSTCKFCLGSDRMFECQGKSSISMHGYIVCHDVTNENMNQY